MSLSLLVAGLLLGGPGAARKQCPPMYIAAVLWFVRVLQLSWFASLGLVPGWCLMRDWLTSYPYAFFGFCLDIPAEYLARLLWLERVRLVSVNRKMLLEISHIEQTRRQDLTRRVLSKHMVQGRHGPPVQIRSAAPPHSTAAMDPIAEDRHLDL